MAACQREIIQRIIYRLSNYVLLLRVGTLEHWSGGAVLSLRKPLGVMFGVMLIFDLCVAWLWHQIGYSIGQLGMLFGLLTIVLNDIGFPIFLILMVYKNRPKEASGWWALRAYVACWFLILLNAVINHVVYTHVTGYYHAMMTSTKAGSGEGIAVHQVLLFIQCIWLTVFMSLFMAWRSWWVRTYG